MGKKENIKETDMVEVCGGPAGNGAALAATWNGLKTLIIEQFNCLGGVATAGGHGHICRYDENGTGRRIVGGIAHEIGQRIEKAGFGIYNSYGIWFEVEGMKLILEQMAQEAKVELLYHTFFSDVIKKGEEIVGVIVQNKNGQQFIKAKRIIDCTGDGDVAFHANCAYEVGRLKDHKCQPVTLMFTIGGVDWKRVQEFMEEYKRNNPADKEPWKLRKVYAQAIECGDLRPFQTGNMGWWWTPTRPDFVGVNSVSYTHLRAHETSLTSRMPSSA